MFKVITDLGYELYFDPCKDDSWIRWIQHISYYERKLFRAYKHFFIDNDKKDYKKVRLKEELPSIFPTEKEQDAHPYDEYFNNYKQEQADDRT